MRCPCCEKPLIVTHEDSYESFDGNGCFNTQGYQCTNEFCAANNLQAVWLEDGSLVTEELLDIKRIVAHNIIVNCSKSKIEYALDSWQHKYETKRRDRESQKIKICVFNYCIFIFPVYSNDDNFIRHPWKKEIELWKKELQCYTKIIPLHKMVKYRIGRFYDYYKRIPSDDKDISVRDAHEIESCAKILYCIEDNRFFAKVTTFILNIFHFRKALRIKKLCALKDAIFSTKTDFSNYGRN